MQKQHKQKINIQIRKSIDKTFNNKKIYINYVN